MPDIINNTNTTSSMGLNATFNGELEITGDSDWVRVSLTDGQFLQVNLNGRSDDNVFDTYLEIYDRNGNLVTFNDDSNFSLYSEATFEATYSGAYYISADSFQGGYTGHYQIVTQAVQAPPPPPSPLSGDDLLDSLQWGQALADTNNINVYFAPRGKSYDGYTSEGFNAYERAQIMAAMEELSDAIDLNFTVVTNQNRADLTLVLDTNEIGNDFLGYFNPPGTPGAGTGVFNGALWDRSAGGDLEQGGFGHVTVVHELLHGLGMAHPHDNGGRSSIMDGVSSSFDDYGNFGLNQGVFTTMTYNSGYFTGSAGSAPADPLGGDFGFEGGAMALDIAVLQGIYGANTSHAGGNSTYFLDNSNGSGTY